MCDATFKAYGGTGYTHSGGGGTLELNDYDGLAALLVTQTSSDCSSADHQLRAVALQRLRDPYGHGNRLVIRTLTCLEREVKGAQPVTTPDSDSDVSADEDAATCMLQLARFHELRWGCGVNAAT